MTTPSSSRPEASSRPEPASRPEAAELAQQLRKLLERHLHVRHFRKGSLLWREGETSGMLVAIRSGRVKAYRLLPNGRAVTLYLFGPDDIFGFLPFLDGGPYPAYAQAIEDVEADVMARSTVLQVLRAEPDLALELITLLGRRLREAFDHIRSLTTPGARARIASALLGLLPEAPTPEGTVHLKLPVTAQEFAGAVGVAPETLSRTLAGFLEDGTLERAGARRYRLLDQPALERAADPPVD